MEHIIKVIGVILTLTILWFGSLTYALDHNPNLDKDIPEVDIEQMIQDRIDSCDIFNMSGIGPKIDDLYIKVDCLKGGKE